MMNYHVLYESGELLRRIGEAYKRLAACDLCPHSCGVNRIKGEKGLCGAGLKPKIASANIHHGEEPPIVGSKGSGTIFLSGCSLKCSFCQNFPISQLGNGQEITTLELANRILKLQRLGAHNINFVTPTHYLPQILAAVWLAIPQGFALPIVWNTSGYEKIDALHLLDGIVDVYLPDMKYGHDTPAFEISHIKEYCTINGNAIKEMFRQVGHLKVNNEMIAVKGLIIRHLVLPNRLAGTRQILGWIAENIGIETHVSLMRQYFPAHKALAMQGIDRKINDQEYEEAYELLEKFGFENGWVQD